jgi:RNA polymerase sigma factor (sigma-70 family)
MMSVMEHATDIELVREYAQKGNEDAFAVLVQRHVDFVYSAALRQVREPVAAQEVTQATFIVLARKAHHFNDRTIVPAWLYRTARFAAADFLKMRARRIKHEQEAAQMEPETNHLTWAQIEPLLDNAMNELGETDRAALILRYFQNKSLREVGAALGISDDTAQKRITRAVDRLRKTFARDGVTLSTDVLIAALPIHTVLAAPESLSISIANMMAANAAISASTATLVKGTLHMIAWTKFKFIAGIATLLVVATGTATIAAQKVTQSKRAATNETQRSTPIGALRYLLDGFAAYDGQKIVDSHITNSIAIQRMVLAISGAVTAEGKLRDALLEKFKSTGGLGPRAAVQMGFGYEDLDTAEEKISGNTATVAIAGRQPHTQYLARVESIWKLTDPTSGADLTAAEPMAQRLDAAARVYNELAEAVRQGRFQNASEVTTALRQRLLKEMRNN